MTLEFGGGFLPACFAFYSEFPTSAFPAVVSESEKIKCRRFSPPFPFAVFLRKPSERDDFRLIFFNFEIEFLQTFDKCIVEVFCITFKLKATHKIIRIADNISFSSTLLLHHFLKPEIQYIV